MTILKVVESRAVLVMKIDAFLTTRFIGANWVNPGGLAGNKSRVARISFDFPQLSCFFLALSKYQLSIYYCCVSLCGISQRRWEKKAMRRKSLIKFIGFLMKYERTRLRLKLILVNPRRHACSSLIYFINVQQFKKFCEEEQAFEQNSDNFNWDFLVRSYSTRNLVNSRNLFCVCVCVCVVRI